ncbi:nitrogen fixation protein NifQ [Allochromatium tepidum]|uniref:ADP-ribosyl-[dinitrogen reductase] hydrolase n=1 Tax=Allochromatium tepidum TaxID=553982 RepID=A0ABM7QIC5_9GAMM|nr:nitrogen fixation protein NifQ [Allochromatium tepidum]BCU05489.1 hypothetical protein Atep_01660 [Allochromatium tepidum]
MIATRAAGGGALPAWLGLDQADFKRLMAHHFPGVSPDVLGSCDGASPLLGNRLEEREELIELLLTHRAGRSPSETWMARVVASGCLADDHLWHDLGLWNRAELTELMRRNFPELAVRNVQDMKWKRFLYKQLCESEGIYVCRAPSCGVCVDYRLQAHVTHHNSLSDLGTLTVIRMTQTALLGGSLEDLRRLAAELVEADSRFAFDGERRQDDPGGYIVETLRAVFQALFGTDGFESALIDVVNRGGDADTTGAILGMIAGALYGFDAIPQRRLKALDRETARLCRRQALDLLSRSQR